MKPSSDGRGAAVGAADASVDADGGRASGDVPPIRIGPSGRVETEAEYHARMAHNSYMRFSRSLRRSLSAY